MTAEIKVLHSSEVRTAKSGTKYRKVLVLIKINSEFLGVSEFIKEFYIFEAAMP